MNFRNVKSFRSYSKNRFIFLIVGSIFHGGMVFTFKTVKEGLKTPENILRAIIGGLGAGIFWGLVFHLMTILRPKHREQKIKTKDGEGGNAI